MNTTHFHIQCVIYILIQDGDCEGESEGESEEYLSSLVKCTATVKWYSAVI